MVVEATFPMVYAKDVYLPDVIHKLGFTKSKSEARRLIKQGGVYFYDPVDGFCWRVTENVTDILNNTIFKVGKRGKWFGTYITNDSRLEARVIQ